ncbi:hypothetical protein D2M30_2543 [Bacillus amyloliquefaciens]|nr:hypothetical protein D2M30_2543 [Bacillus amyloliquefaciens]
MPVFGNIGTVSCHVKQSVNSNMFTDFKFEGNINYFKNTMRL